MVVDLHEELEVVDGEVEDLRRRIVVGTRQWTMWVHLRREEEMEKCHSGSAGEC